MFGNLGLLGHVAPPELACNFMGYPLNSEAYGGRYVNIV